LWNYLKELTRLPRGVRQFLYAEPLLGIAFGMFALLLNFHFLESGMSEIQIGQLTSLQMIIMGVSAIPFGLLADRTRRKYLIVGGLMLIGVSYFIIGIGSTFTHFVLGQVVSALGISLLISSEIPLLYNYCANRREETQTYNMMFAIFTLFTGVGTLFGGFLPDWLPKGDTKYESTIYFIGGLVLIVGMIRMLLPPEIKKQRTDYPSTSNGSQSIPILPTPKPVPTALRMSLVDLWRKGWNRLPSRNVFLFVGFSFFAGGTFGFLIPYFNVIIKFRMDWSDEWVSLLLTANGLFLFLASLFTPLILDRFGLRKSAFLLLGGTTGMTLLLAFHLPASGFILLFLLRNGGYMAAINLLEGQSLQATKDEERGLHAGLRSVARSVASTLAAFATGYILELKNYLLPFLLTGLLLVMSLVYVHFLMIRKLEEELSKDNETDTEIYPSASV
jgi:DHA1 family multidrug resistance protein-like MFS transporter